ncbi:hypothetical protein WBG99_13725 [Streptomyces sp. TG1A-60]
MSRADYRPTKHLRFAWWVRRSWSNINDTALDRNGDALAYAVWEPSE